MCIDQRCTVGTSHFYHFDLVGECEPCDKVAEKSCVCGRSVEERPCNSPSWHCTKVSRKGL